MGEIDLRTDGELLVATASDPEAFGVFYSRHVRGMLAFFRRRVGSPEVALRLTAETFATALEASGRYELRPEPARSWLYGIAWSKLHDADYGVYTRDPALSGRFHEGGRWPRPAPASRPVSQSWPAVSPRPGPSAQSASRLRSVA
jgi:DNA-directed RNA polymerase specialized sigma24 family protein